MTKSKHRGAHGCSCETCQQHPFSRVAKYHKALTRVLAACDEKTRRRVVGVLAQQWGSGSISHLRRITGLSRNTIQRSKYEIEHPARTPSRRIRQPGAGRQCVEKNNRASLPH